MSRICDPDAVVEGWEPRWVGSPPEGGGSLGGERAEKDGSGGGDDGAPNADDHTWTIDRSIFRLDGDPSSPLPLAPGIFPLTTSRTMNSSKRPG